MGVFGWRKGKGEMILFYYNIKNRRKKFNKKKYPNKTKTAKSVLCLQ